MKQNYYKIILLGSVWGIAEATLGFLLHKMTLGIGWIFWFPVAFLFLNSCYQWTKSYAAVLFTALIASSIKMINLFFTVRYDFVFNPAVSILIEAISFIAVYSYLTKRHKNPTDILGIACIGFLWRILYACYVVMLPSELVQISPIASMISFSRFMFFENIMNTVLISAFMIVWNKYININTIAVFKKIKFETGKQNILKPTISFVSILLAVVVKLLTV